MIIGPMLKMSCICDSCGAWDSETISNSKESIGCFVNTMRGRGWYIGNDRKGFGRICLCHECKTKYVRIPLFALNITMGEVYSNGWKPIFAPRCLDCGYIALGNADKEDDSMQSWAKLYEIWKRRDDAE